jgi:glycosyltransferase involved in cell wall biosynthesis
VATDILERKPLFEATMRHAVAVLCHTGPAFDAVSARKFVPVHHLELPFAIGPDVSSARAKDGPLKLAQFGHIGRNRRLEQVLEVLSPLAAEMDFLFDIYGKVWDEAFVMRKAESLGLGGRVRIHGFVDEPVLDAALREAHLVFNLRYPTMGEASGSQLRIWNAAALAAVTDLGWYASLPPDTVAHVPLDKEAEALADLLRKINADRRYGEAIGEAGRRRLAAHHSPALYADGIVAIATRYAEDARNGLLSEAARGLLGRSPSPASAGQALSRQRLGELLSS